MSKRRTRFHFNGNGRRLFRAGIISFKSGSKVVVDLDKLVNMTDEELLKVRGVGQKTLSEINAVRKQIAELLFTNK